MWFDQQIRISELVNGVEPWTVKNITHTKHTYVCVFWYMTVAVIRVHYLCRQIQNVYLYCRVADVL